MNHTIPHQTSARYGGADIFLRPASHGTGVIAGWNSAYGGRSSRN